MSQSLTHIATRREWDSATAPSDAMAAALEIRLRQHASFQEKLHQLVGK
jgi:hypothetical protein